MKNFLINLCFVILVFAVGFFGVRLVNYQADVRQLQGRIEELEREQVHLQQQVSLSTNKVVVVASPEDLRLEIEQTVSDRRGMMFRQPVRYQTVKRDELQQILVNESLVGWTPQEISDYTRALEALGLVPGGTSLTNIWASVCEGQRGAYYSWKDKTVYVEEDLDLTKSMGRVLLSRAIAHVLQDQNWGLANLLQRTKDNDDLNLARAAMVHGDALLVLTRMYSDNVDRAGLLRDIGALVADRSERVRYAPAFIRESMLFPFQEGFRCWVRLEGRWQWGFQGPTTTEQIYHPEKARLAASAQKDVYTPVALTVVDSTTWRLIGNNVLGEFGIRQLFTTRLKQIDVEVAADGWDGDRYHVYERGINGPTGVIWRTIWDTEIDAEEFEEGYQDFARSAKVPARIVRDGVFVTVVQSTHPSFDGLAQEALQRSGVTGFFQAALP